MAHGIDFRTVFLMSKTKAMGNFLTDRQFWIDYWESKTGLSVNIPEHYLFHRELRDIVRREKVNNAIELGGFPGYYAVFLKKYFGLDVTLLDYFVHMPVIRSLLQANGLEEGDITVIEADLFGDVPQQQYDLVLSCGLIEHFEDTADVIRRHIGFLRPGGTLFITLPNFRALNGWFQKRFDRENYDKHNIRSMDPGLLAQICRDAGLEVLRSGYYGYFSIWLENEAQKPSGVRWLKKLAWISGKVFTRVFRFNSRQLSPYIILEARSASSE